MTRCRSSLAHGARVKPQLPMTTLVMPCQQERGAERIPEDLGVHVGVAVHEARRDDPALRVDDLAGAFAEPTDGDDLAGLHAHVGAVPRQAGSVHHPSVLDQQVIGHRAGSSSPRPGVSCSIVAQWYPYLAGFRPTGGAGYAGGRHGPRASSTTSTGGTCRCTSFYESRLRLLEKYDAAGFYSYHLAEHHATPLGLAPMPGHLPGRGHPAHAPHPPRALRLLPAALQPAPADRGGVHARSPLARPLRLRRGPRHRPLRDGLLRSPPPRDRGASTRRRSRSCCRG